MYMENYTLSQMEIAMIKKALRDRLDVLTNSYTEAALIESQQIRELISKLGD